MKTIKTNIIPVNQTFVKLKDVPHELNYKAICVFSAIGFFLDNDTYWKDEVVLRPGTINLIDDDGYLIKEDKWFEWHYSPSEVSLEKCVAEFAVLFEKITEEQTLNKKVILPLSGGLDSRSQAAALKQIKANVASYSYSFENGYKESKISKKIAKSQNFEFHEYKIEKEYLWKKINDLAAINNCYSDFTHPRQMAVIDEINKLGEVFSLGHWGDVLFDSEGIENITDKELLTLIKKKIVKKGGIELANALWSEWNLKGEFTSYLDSRLLKLLSEIKIENVNSKIRAFKSMYWAPRWTSINLAIFESVKPITLPFYDDRMCEFICTIPEEFLANRQIQINYIKLRSKSLANIVWQDKRPFNLNNYQYSKFPYNIPYRLQSKIKRIFKELIGIKHVQRNWELQFLGGENEKNLKRFLLDDDDFISTKLKHSFLDKFYNEDTLYYSHSVSLLLTLSFFERNIK